jgi:hypothetical protein
MTASATLRRLIDLEGVRDLEYKALLNPRLSEVERRADYPEFDVLSKALFGLTAEEAEAVVRPDDWDDIDKLEPRDQVESFEAEGWDVTDDKRRPLRLLGQLAPALWLALRGVAGTLPFQPEPDTDDLEAKLAKEAARFRKNKY